jgi:hypothetical protein
VHAALEKRKKEQEEEEMTRYTREELDGDWEFKIVRSVTGDFKKRDIVEQLRAEEALAGWVMVEKFDNNRIRFKRPASAQRKDDQLPPHIDPYRTQYGWSDFRLAMTILGACFLAVGLIVFLVNTFN